MMEYIYDCKGDAILDADWRNDVEFLNEENVPTAFYSDMESLRFIRAENVMSIGDNFLLGFKNLKEIDLWPLRGVHTIGNCFLYQCVSLEQINLDPLRRLTTIGEGFLYGCKSLSTITVHESQTELILSKIPHFCDELIYIPRKRYFTSRAVFGEKKGKQNND